MFWVGGFFFSFLFFLGFGRELMRFFFFGGGGGNRDAGTEVREFDQKT